MTPSPPEARPKTPNAWEWKRYAFKLEVELRELQDALDARTMALEAAEAVMDSQEVELRELQEALRKIEVFADHHRNDAYAVQQILRVVRGLLAASSEEPG